MVVLGRNEINRARLAGALAIVMASAVLIGIASIFAGSSEPVRLGLVGLGLAGVVTLILSLFQLLSRRSASKLILFHQGNDYVVATNHLHDGFKLRFFRDVLSDGVGPFSDDERIRWNVLSQEGFHPVFVIRNARKTLILPIGYMLFDEVFVCDHTQRWDYYDCRKTSDPTFSRRGVSPFKNDEIIPRKEQPATQ